MSGGLGPSKDLGVATATVTVEAEHESEAKRAHDHPPHPRRRRLFSLRQLNSLAVIIVLSASGMVALEDLSFFLFSLAYVVFLSRVVFPPPPSGSDPDLTDSRGLTAYASAGVVVGLLLPIVYIFHGILEGDKGGIKAATPHAFLLAGQMFAEGAAEAGGSSAPVRAFVPTFYNAKRLIAISEWVRSEVVKAEEEEYGSARRLHIGRGLALLNLAFWSVNLFGILVPVYLPRAFKSYYGGKEKPL